MRQAVLDAMEPLFDLEPIEEPPPALEVAFEDFHARHPEVFAELHRMTLELVGRGHGRLGIGMLYEVVRWRTLLGELEGDQWRLNNNHRSRYSRLLMESDPRLAGVFELRSLHDDPA